MQHGLSWQRGRRQSILPERANRSSLDLRQEKASRQTAPRSRITSATIGGRDGSLSRIAGNQGRKGPSRGLDGTRRGGPDGRRCRRAHQPFDHQLQGRLGADREISRRSPLADDSRHRFRRHGRALGLARLQGRRRGDPQRLGARRNASGRLFANGARSGRLAGRETCRASPPRKPWRSAPPAIRPCCA